MIRSPNLQSATLARTARPIYITVCIECPKSLNEASLRMADRLALYPHCRRTAGNGFISFISLISMGGIALGVSALIIVLSVMNGFQKEVRDRMLSVLAHIEILS